MKEQRSQEEQSGGMTIPCRWVFSINPLSRFSRFIGVHQRHLRTDLLIGDFAILLRRRIEGSPQARRGVLVVDPEAVAQFLELIAVDVVGRMQMFGFRDEFEGVVAAEAVLQHDRLERLQVVGIDE